MCNHQIRNYAKEQNVKLWQIAAELGVNDGNFSRKLRKEFSAEEQKRITEIIDTLAAQQQEAQYGEQ